MPEAVAKLENVLVKVEEKIFKEENRMIPMLTEKLTQDEWKLIADESGEIGFLIDNIFIWNPIRDEIASQIDMNTAEVSGQTKLPSGVFNIEELTCMLNTLPFDITFVNKDVSN